MIADRLPSVIAHRGAPFEAVENTASAFQCALNYPISGIECDIQMTRDGVLILFHDFTLRRLTGAVARISDSDWVDIQSCQLGEHENILRLEDLLTQFGSRTSWMFELKVDHEKSEQFTKDMIRSTVELLEGFTPYDFRILCFDSWVLEEIYRERPDWSLALNLDGHIDSNIFSAEQLMFLNSWSINHEQLSESLAESAKLSGKRLITWTCDDTRSVDRALDYGVDFIITNKPAWLCEYLEGKKKS